MNLGEKLFELRRGKKLTQDEVAETLDVTRQTVSKWETGQSLPDFDKIVPLCRLYGISPDDLFLADGGKEKDCGGEKGGLFSKIAGSKSDGGYENMTRDKAKQKSAEVVSRSIFIFFIATAYAGIAVPVLKWNPIVVGCTFLVLVGWGAARIVRHYMSVPKFERTKEEERQGKVERQISRIVGVAGAAVYFIVSFGTMAWHITWIIFIIAALVRLIVSLAFMLAEDRSDEK